MGRIVPQFDKAEHDRELPKHSGAYGHYCPDWDYMYICDDCHEREGCTCQRVPSSAAHGEEGK